MLEVIEDLNNIRVFTLVDNSLAGSGPDGPDAKYDVESFEATQIIEANIINENLHTVDIKFTNGRQAFNINKDKIRPV